MPALLLPIGIVGGVRIGMYTATEAGAVAVIYSLLIGHFLIRKMNLRDVVCSVRESLHDVAAIMFVVAAASPFAWVLVTEQVPQKIAAALGEMVSHPALLLLMINGFLVVVGLFMEMVAAMVILVPILVPIILKAGIDPVHFGIILVMNIVMGALTPPMGVLIFTSARIAKADVAEVFKAALPFIFSIFVVPDAGDLRSAPEPPPSRFDRALATLTPWGRNGLTLKLKKLEYYFLIDIVIS